MITAIVLNASVVLVHFWADEWKGFVYPNASNLVIHVEIGKFDSLEECRSSAIGVLNAAGWGNVGAYECGKNCRPPTSEFAPLICEETSK